MRIWRGFVWLLGWAFCAVGLHAPPAGLNLSMSIAWICMRCQERVPGGLSTKHKRRRNRW